VSIKYSKQPSSQKTTPSFLLTKKLPATLIKQSTGQYVNGVWVEAEDSRTIIQVNAQPLKGHEMFQMAESERAREWMKFYTTDTVETVQTQDGSTANRIVFDGKEYEVARTSAYKMGVLNHTKIIASLITGNLA
jgi:hypothetical protein